MISLKSGGSAIKVLAATVALTSGLSVVNSNVQANSIGASVYTGDNTYCITLNDTWGKEVGDGEWTYEFEDNSYRALIPSSEGHIKTTYSDVPASAWYYDSVDRVTKLGYMQGYDGKFMPSGYVTKAEILSILCRTKGIVRQPVAGGKWYSGYINYLNNELNWRIKSSETDSIATRQNIADYVVWFYGLDNDVSYMKMVDKFPKFYEDTDNRWARILWDKGIMTGTESSQGKFKFNGDSAITRAELSQVICNIDDVLIHTNIKDERTPLGEGPNGEWTDEQRNEMLDHSYYEDLAVYMETPLGGSEDIAKAIGYMLYTNTEEARFEVVDSSKNWDYYKKVVEDAWEMACESYLEFKEPGCKLTIWYNKDSSKQLRLALRYPTSDHTERTEKFKSKCEDILIEMIESGQITQDMSEKEKAAVIFRYVALTLEYDTTYVKNSGYDAVTYSKTACQGYTSMFDYMCKLAGIPMESEVGYVNVGDGKIEYHAWSRCFVDGEWRYSDSTFSDPVPNKEGYCNRWYFWRANGFPDRQVKN